MIIFNSCQDFFYLEIHYHCLQYQLSPLNIKLNSIFLVCVKELYTGTPNSDMRKLCTVLCGRNVNKPSAPTEVEGKGLKL